MKPNTVCKPLLCVAILIVTPFLLLVGLPFITGTLRGPRDFAREVASLKRDGIPVNPAELQAPLPPASKNAAPVYLQLAEVLRRRPITAKDDDLIANVGRLGPSTSSEDKALGRVLNRRTDVLELVHRAAARTACVFVKDWAKGPALSLPEYKTMREGARIIRAEAYLLAKSGRFHQALQVQMLGFRIAHQAGTGPVLIAYLVGVACDSIALDGVQNILLIGGLKPGVAEDARRLTLANLPLLSLRHGMAGEVASMAMGSRLIIRKQPEPPSPWPPLQGLQDSDRVWRDDLTDSMMAPLLHEIHEFIRITALPEAQQRSASRRFFANWDRQVKKSGSADGLRLTLASILLPIFQEAVDKSLENHARENVTIAAAAVLTYRARHGAFPTDLKTSAADIPIDPFSQKPLGYRRKGNGFVLYSVGRTGHFTGTPPLPGKAYSEIFFRFPASAARQPAGSRS